MVGLIEEDWVHIVIVQFSLFNVDVGWTYGNLAFPDVATLLPRNPMHSLSIHACILVDCSFLPYIY